MRRRWRAVKFWTVRGVLRFVLWGMPAEYVLSVLVFKVLLSAIELDEKRAA